MMSDSMEKLKHAKRATQLVFFVCGVGISSWAAMVPFAKDRLGLNDGELGYLLLLLGAGAIIMMPVTGLLINRLGARKVILMAGIIVAIFLPLLTTLSTRIGMGFALFMFGCGIGSVDVAMNTHGVKVEHLYGRPIMSSLHGLFSTGGLLGALGLGILIKMGLDPLLSAVCIATILLLLMLSQYKYLMDFLPEKDVEKRVVVEKEKPKGIGWLTKSLLLLGFMCFSVFLVEGAMLDWSAVFLRDVKHISVTFAGIGYAVFSVAMAVMRMLGDKIRYKLQGKTIVVGGCIIAVIGMLCIIQMFSLSLVVGGFALLGIGAANIVPIFLTEGSKLPGVSPTLGISTVSTMGYAGQLAGPTLLGHIAQAFSLEIAFGFVALLLAVVALLYSFRKVNG